MVLTFMSIAFVSTSVFAQENGKKDKAKSNKRQLRQLKFKTRSKQGEKAYRGDITGRKVITKTSPKRPKAGYAKPSSYASATTSSETSRKKAKFTSPRFTNRRGEKAWKGRPTAIRSGGKITFTGKRYQGSNVRSASRDPERPKKVTRVVPRTASGAYTTRKKKSPYSSFRKSTPWEKAYKGDITGRKFRTKRTEDRPKIKAPPLTKFIGTRRKGERASSARGGYQTASRYGEKARTKDISGNKLRIRTSSKPKSSRPNFSPYQFKKRRGDVAYSGKKGINNRSISKRRETSGNPILSRSRRNAGISGFAGRQKAMRPLKGGGSISGRSHNNKNSPIVKKATTRQDSRIAGFQGGLKGGKPFKGGGSISRRQWNNKGKPVLKRATTRQDNRIAGFQGNLKGGKPFRGGGSVSRNHWNNKGNAVLKRATTRQDNKIAGFSGSLKGGKPLKGGGSVSRNHWNNKGSAVLKRATTRQDSKIAGFSGKFKRYKPLKGGGSKTRGQWNNNGQPVISESILDRNDKLTFFKGRRKAVKPLKGGGSVSREGWNNNEKQVNPDRLTSQDFNRAVYIGRIKRKRNYNRHNPKSADDALKVKPATKAMMAAGNYQGNVNMKRKAINGRHPSYRFEKASSDDSKVKKKLNGVKMLWAKIFKKNENQPDHLKEKEKRPRFDKREKELWND